MGVVELVCHHLPRAFQHMPILDAAFAAARRLHALQRLRVLAVLLHPKKISKITPENAAIDWGEVIVFALLQWPWLCVTMLHLQVQCHASRWSHVLRHRDGLHRDGLLCIYHGVMQKCDNKCVVESPCCTRCASPSCLDECAAYCALVCEAQTTCRHTGECATLHAEPRHRS